MWDRPDQLNRLSSVLFAIAGLAIGYALVLYVARLPIFPLRQVEVLGKPAHVTYEQVADIVRTELRGNFFTLNLPAARRAFEKLPWVHAVNVRRKWPDRLEITVEEQVPLARWGDDALVNVQGELFRAAYDGKLPVFVGPPGSEKEIAIQYNYFRDTLAHIRETPVAVRVTERGAWEVDLADGMKVALGREHVEERLSRFVDAYERSIALLQRRVDYVDLRYSNGFAVRIAGLAGRSGRGDDPARKSQGTPHGKDARKGGARTGGADRTI
jgi:cell division protein FtsQ